MALATLVYENEVSDAEWETRCDLAALYRIFHNMRMTDLVYTHLSARVPDEPNCFLMNQYGEMFDEVTASSLVKMNLDGEMVGRQGAFNSAGFTIHSACYLAREDVGAVIHLHTRASIAVASVITKKESIRASYLGSKGRLCTPKVRRSFDISNKLKIFMFFSC